MSWIFFLAFKTFKVHVDLTHYVVPAIQYKVLGLYICGSYSLVLAHAARVLIINFHLQFLPPPLSLSLSLSLSHTHTKVIKCINAFDWFVSIQHRKCFHVVKRLKRRKS
jgi:hypothetical protein